MAEKVLSHLQGDTLTILSFRQQEVKKLRSSKGKIS